DLPDAPQHLLGQRVELRSAVVDGRIVHRAQDPVGDVGRPGDLQEMPAARVGIQAHGCLFLLRRGPSASLGATQSDLSLWVAFCIQYAKLSPAMDGMNFPIARSTLPEAAAERLRTLIIEGELAPGARLNERELSERLGVSRTPLREAFRMLAADGLLVQLPNRGAQVVSLSREDVRHAFEVMASLE